MTTDMKLQDPQIIDETKTNQETGLEYVTGKNGIMRFRKPKR